MVTSQDGWPRLFGGAESAESARLREQTFKKLWNEAEERIERVVNEVDEGALDDVFAFVAAGAISGSQLRTGLIVSGTDANAQKLLLHQWKHKRLNKSNDIAIRLHAGQTPNLQTALKNIIRTAVEAHEGPSEYTSLLARKKKLIPMNFDLELLQVYMEERSLDKVVVSMVDVETFDVGVLSDLLSTLASWTDRIPVVLLVGIATTVDLFESRLAKSTVRLLDAHVFEIGSKKDLLYSVYAAVQHSPDTVTYFGPAVISVLQEMAQDQSTTVDAMKRTIKYCYISHFFANPLSILLSGSTAPDEDDEFETPHVNNAERTTLCEAIRCTSTFASHCEKLLAWKSGLVEDVRMLLNDDEYLLNFATKAAMRGQCIPQLESYTVSTVVTIWSHVQHLMPRDQTSQFTPFRLELDILKSPADFAESAFYADLIETLPKMVASTLHSIISSLPAYPEGTPHNGPASHVQGVIECYQEAPRHVSANNPVEAKEVEYLIMAISSLLSSLQPERSQSLHFMQEAYTYNLPHPLKTTSAPRARSAIERALLEPADYLGCECCSAEDGTRSEPTAVLYGLLEDAGREVNVKDLWDAFVSRVEGGAHSNGGTKHTANGDVGERSDYEEEAEGVDATEVAAADEEKHVLSLFYRSLAELKMLGLVKSASSKMKGVDVIAKTTWRGL